MFYIEFNLHNSRNLEIKDTNSFTPTEIECDFHWGDFHEIPPLLYNFYEEPTYWILYKFAQKL
jgi:hypothetical protein